MSSRNTLAFTFGSGAFPSDAACEHRHGYRHADQRDRCQRPHSDAEPVPVHEFPDGIHLGRWPGDHRLVVEIAANVVAERVRRFVPAAAVVLDRLQGDPVQVAAQLSS
jgi:hypothetical protein